MGILSGRLHRKLYKNSMNLGRSCSACHLLLQWRIPPFIRSFPHQIFTEQEIFRPFSTQVFLPVQNAKSVMAVCYAFDCGGKEGRPLGSFLNEWDPTNSSPESYYCQNKEHSDTRSQLCSQKIWASVYRWPCHCLHTWYSSSHCVLIYTLSMVMLWRWALLTSFKSQWRWSILRGWTLGEFTLSLHSICIDTYGMLGIYFVCTIKGHCVTLFLLVCLFVWRGYDRSFLVD